MHYSVASEFSEINFFIFPRNASLKKGIIRKNINYEILLVKLEDSD